MRIILLRHGRPDVSAKKRISSVEFAGWVDAYNASCLDTSLPPKPELVSVANSCSKVMCSTLTRSIESAQMLGIELYQSEACFKEAELPIFKIPLFIFKANIWLIIFRILWFFGVNRQAESFTDTKLRARSCAVKLQQIASSSDSVLFVGHGILNKFSAKE
jgi:broad specificity phosphatase PhoE